MNFRNHKAAIEIRSDFPQTDPVASGSIDAVVFPLPRPRFHRWGFLLVGVNDLHHGGFISKRAAFNIEVQVSPKQEKRNRLPWGLVDGLIAGAIFAWLYNWSVDRFQTGYWNEPVK